MPAKYPCSTIADMAEIPDEARDRFLAELPHMLKALRQMREAAPTLGAEMRAKAPWPLSRLPLSFYENAVRTSVWKRITWTDDDKGTATLRMATRHGAEPFYSRTEKITP